ncbi:unnamed protein product, partial [Staurois parvus]
MSCQSAPVYDSCFSEFAPAHYTERHVSPISRMSCIPNIQNV